MPTPYPMAFRRDVIAVARKGDQSIAQVARSFGVSESCLNRWLRVADREDGAQRPPAKPVDEVQVRELLRRNKQLEQEVEILRRTASRNRVNRLCTQQRLWSVHAKKRGLHRKPGPPVHDDLVERRFTAAAPNQLWLTDLTEHPTAEGKLYFCAIKDACGNRIVGYSMAKWMTSQLAVDALANPVALRRPVDTIVQSDRGSEFRSHAYVQELRRHGLHGSLGRVGACADNAAMESFFSLLQKNVLNRRRW